MNRIGKTIIVKVILNNIKHKYDASCFIKSISYSCNSYKISYNILELFKVKEDSKVGHSNLR